MMSKQRQETKYEKRTSEIQFAVGNLQLACTYYLPL